MKINQKGVALLAALALVVIIAIIGSVGYIIFDKNKDATNPPNAVNNSAQVTPSNTPKIKHLGVEFGDYDPATNMAGDFKFTKATLSSGAGMQMLFMEFGHVIPANSAMGGRSKGNPQPTYIVPLGTKVRAIADGIVYDVPKLYSNDYSVMIQGEGSDLIFEMEHVINVVVKKGDKVNAGDIVAEVSDYDARNYDGLGLVEIGILKPGNPPSHVCPFDYLDDSIKEESFNKINSLKKAWEAYRGDATIYDESNTQVPGCITSSPIEG
jgi:murein DD-endopeptidase MepM/ murein hydrolase activator NlpD